MSVQEIAQAAKLAFGASQLLEAKDRELALHALKQALLLAKEEILLANAQDVEAAKLAVADGQMDSTLLKRLDLKSSAGKFDDMLAGVEAVANLPDPNEVIQSATKLDDGLELYQIACPIGVLLCIFEARPEVIVNIASLAIKSGNAAILKGGKESLKTQAVLKRVIHAALGTTKVPSSFIQTVESRSEIAELLQQDRFIDLVIPRGSNELVRSIQQATKIPVMGHADGICAVYVDQTAKAEKAMRCILDAKTSYTAACNSAETLLVHEGVLQTIWPALAQALLEAQISLKCDDATRQAIPQTLRASHQRYIQEATESDFSTEFLTLTFAVRAVPSIQDALIHINTHGSHHTDAIITEDPKAMKLFTQAIDSAGVYVNASTRFADGFRYGFGTEVGVSTCKTHARGPVGLQGLMIYKYIVQSTGEEGHVSHEYGSTGKAFKHEKLQADKLPF